MDTIKTTAYGRLLAFLAIAVLAVALALGAAPPPAYANGGDSDAFVAGSLQTQDDSAGVPAELRLANLKFAIDNNPNGNEYPLSPAFDPAVKEYTLTVPIGGLNRVGYVFVEREGTTQGAVTVEYISTQTNELVVKNVESGEAADIGTSYSIKTYSTEGTVVTVKVGGQEAYVVNVVRQPELTQLNLRADSGRLTTSPAFNSAVTEYVADIAADASVTASLVCNSNVNLNLNPSFAVNGAATTMRVNTPVEIQWGNDHTFDLVASIEVEGCPIKTYTVRLRELAASLSVEHGPNATEYEAGKPFDPTGMVVNAVYPNGDVVPVSLSDLSFEPSVIGLGTEKVTVSYAGASADVAVQSTVSLEGSGTEDEPYLISDAADYEYVRALVEKGVFFSGVYLKQVADVELPDGWTPIGTADPGAYQLSQGGNMRAFSGNLDGGGHLLKVPKGGMPLFGYVLGASVKNLDVYGERIESNGLVDSYAGIGLAGLAISIDNVTLKSGSSTLLSAFIGGKVGKRAMAASAAAYTVEVKNCTVEQGVTVGYDGAQTNVGGIVGRISGTVTNCVSYADVKGADNVAGIATQQDNSMGDFVIRNCEFHGTVTASGEYAGGIVACGYLHNTAPNARGVQVIDCVCDGVIIGAKNVGGILGAEPGVDQHYENGHGVVVGNAFAGTVSGQEHVGGVIGYYRAMSKYVEIVSNYYASSCGVDKGIGYVTFVDTNAVHYPESEDVSWGWHDGSFYYDSSLGYTAADWEVICGEIDKDWDNDGATGYSARQYSYNNMKPNMNRTDDPLGADAEKLCFTEEQLADYAAVDEALATVPEGFDQGLYTDESIKALEDAITAANARYKPQWEQSAVDAMAQAVEDAIAGLKVDENKAFAAAEVAVTDAQGKAEAAKQAADDFEALKAAADAETDLVKKAIATANAAIAAVDAAAKADDAKQAADAAAAAAKLAARAATSDEMRDKALDLYEQAKDAQAVVASAAAAAAAAAKQAQDDAVAADAAAKQAQDAAKAPKDNPMKVAAKSVKAKAKKLKKKAQTVAAVDVSGAEGAVTYKIASIKAKKKLAKQARKKIKMAAGGKLKLKKKLKKGTYKVAVTVTAAGNASYKAATQTVTVKVKVK